MFLARDKKGDLINALENEVKKQAYYCPACGTSVRLKKGKNVRTHFAHESLKSCDFYHENEGPEHLENKVALFNWAKKDAEVEMEYPIPELKQIADILINKRLALEVQCSPISCELLRERSNGYRSLGIQVLWLLGEKLWLKERLTQLQRDFLYFSNNMGFHLWELDQEKRVLRLKYLIHEDLHGKVQHKTKNFPFGHGRLLDILRLPFQKQEMNSFLAQQDPQICNYIRRQLYYQQPRWMRLQAQLYQNGDNLLTKTAEDFYPQVRPIQAAFFCQITNDLTGYYQQFETYYANLQQKNLQIVYSPAFYTRILR